MAQIRCDKAGAIWVLTIDNQRKRNAFSGDMVRSLCDYLDKADRTPSVRCVVITGAGRGIAATGQRLPRLPKYASTTAGWLETSLKLPSAILAP